VIISLDFFRSKDTKNYTLYEQHNGINKLYLAKDVKNPQQITFTATVED